MFRTSLLFLAFYIASRNCALIPDLPNSGSVGFRVDLNQRNAQFGESVRDWFKNMKNKIFGKKTPNKANLPNPLDLDTESLEAYESGGIPERLTFRPRTFFLDLTNLKFDPSKDWGFRVGKWYVIRKSSAWENAYTSRSTEDWSRWREFVKTRNDYERCRGWRDNKEDPFGIQESTEATSPTTATTSRTLIPETTLASSAATAGGEKKEGGKNGGRGAVTPAQGGDLSVEILRPQA